MNKKNQQTNLKSKLLLNYKIKLIQIIDESPTSIAKRLPKSSPTPFGVCWFCEENPMNLDANIDIKLEKIISSKPAYNAIGQYGVIYEFEKKSCSVPRCKTCKHIHSKVRIVNGLFRIINGLFIIGGCWFITQSKMHFLTYIFSAIIFSLMILFPAYLHGVFIMSGFKDIKDELLKYSYPELLQLIDKGWVIVEKGKH